MNLVPITDVCDFQGGTQPPKSEWSDKALDGYVRMLQIRDFTQRERTTPEYVKDAKKLKKCSADDVLIGRYGASVGKILRGLEGAYNVAIVRSIPDESKVTKDFLYYLFKGPVFQSFIRTVGERAAQAGFNKTDLKKFRIALLSLDEQKRIAHVLGKVEELINQRKQSIQQLDELVKSIFLDMFGDPVQNEKAWDVVPFHKVGKFTSGGTPSKSRDDFWDGTFPWVSPKDMKVEKISDSINHISESVFEETSLKKVLPNHLLIVVRGMILAHSFPVAINTVDVSINQDMKAINPTNDFEVEYLLHCLVALKRQILKLISTAGHGTRKFDSNAMKKLFIPKPAKPLQQKFCEIANKVEVVKSQYQHSLRELENLYGVLNQKAFKGELDLSLVPLPDENVTDNTSFEQQEKQTINKIENAILSFSQFNADDLNNIELRKTQLGKWFKEWLEQYEKESDLNINHFWQSVEFTTQDYIDESDNPFDVGLSDYDYIKTEIFNAIKNGIIEQTTNMIKVEVDGKPTIEPGNQILLKKLN